MRKPQRLTAGELAPYQWQMPLLKRRQGSEVRSQMLDVVSSPTPDSCLLTPDLLNWAALFGNDHPVEVEVGMGKGLFMLTEAMGRPDVNFFGIEIVRKYQLYATTRFAIRQLPNVKTVCADAKWVLRRFVPAASVAVVHILFPDPWWKARHKKRRVFTSEFACDAARVLRHGGRLHIASDVEEYFGVMTGIVGAMPAFRKVKMDSVETTGYRTNFERKAKLKGTPIWEAYYERTAED